MKRPSAQQTEIAQRLLVHEAHLDLGPHEIALVAGRVHQKLFACLASLLGADGARALQARSVRSASVDFPVLRGLHFEDRPDESPAERLMTCLRAETPAVATEMAVMLCAQLLALLTTLIGERLALQILRTAWPTFDPNAPSEKETE